jgi:hypothetical protein
MYSRSLASRGHPRAQPSRRSDRSREGFYGLVTALAVIARTNQTASITGVVRVTEPFLTVPEIAKILRLDRHTVCRLFADEPGVIVIGNGETRRGQRKYRLLRVPTAVLNRVVARMTVR